MWKLAGIFLLFFPVFAQAGAQKMEASVCTSASAGLFFADVPYKPVTRQQFVSVSASEKKAMAIEKSMYLISCTANFNLVLG